MSEITNNFNQQAREAEKAVLGGLMLETERFDSVNHPFTAPKDSDIENVLSNPGDIISKGYDIVINGYEVAGGSIRIHDHKLQKIYLK